MMKHVWGLSRTLSVLEEVLGDPGDDHSDQNEVKVKGEIAKELERILKELLQEEDSDKGRGMKNGLSRFLTTLRQSVSDQNFAPPSSHPFDPTGSVDPFTLPEYVNRYHSACVPEPMPASFTVEPSSPRPDSSIVRFAISRPLTCFKLDRGEVGS